MDGTGEVGRGQVTKGLMHEIGELDFMYVRESCV